MRDNIGVTQLRARVAALAGDADLLDAIVDAARGNSEVVAALPRQDTVRHVLALIAAALAAFAADRPLSEAELDAAARLGAERAAQGVPLAALLDGFQAGRAAAVRLAVRRARAAGVDAELLLDLIVELDTLITALEHRLTHAHHATELDQVRTAREQRALLLRALLLGEPTASGADPATALGLDPHGRYRCLVSAEPDPAAAYRLESRLSASLGGVYGMLNGHLAGVCPAAADPAALRLDTLVVHGPDVPTAALPDTYRLCRAARAAAPDNAEGVLALADLALDTAIAAAPGFGAVLVGARLRTLRPDNRFHRELVATALASLDHAGRLDATAQALHVHPNTVKYRLRRLRELTGFGAAPATGGAVRDAAHWWWALRAWPRAGDTG